MRADIRPGAPSPNYELPDHTGRPRRLSEIQGEDPMVIVLARQAYSAKDQAQHEGLVQLWREMKPGVGYCRMVTITTTDSQEALNYRNGVGAEWPFLADPGRVVQRDLDIAEYTDPAHNQLGPHTIVCEPGLIVFKLYDGYWFFGRPTVEELRHDLRAVLMKHHRTGICQTPTSSARESTARSIASTRPSLAGRRMLLVAPAQRTRTLPSRAENPKAARPQPQK
jgi:peroxiredoxin